MKTRNSFIALGAAALAAVTLNAAASGALLSPRAVSNQIKHVASTANEPNLAATDQGVIVSPKAWDNQIKTVSGVADNANFAAACQANMKGSPKMVQFCAEHPGTMPACKTVTIAPLK